MRTEAQRDAHRKRMRASRVAAIAEGRCARCFVERAPKGRKQCIPCTDRARAQSAAYRTAARDHGRCLTCASREARPGRATCEVCARKMATYERRQPTRSYRALPKDVREYVRAFDAICEKRGSVPLTSWWQREERSLYVAIARRVQSMATFLRERAAALSLPVEDRKNARTAEDQRALDREISRRRRVNAAAEGRCIACKVRTARAGRTKCAKCAVASKALG